MYVHDSNNLTHNVNEKGVHLYISVDNILSKHKMGNFKGNLLEI